MLLCHQISEIRLLFIKLEQKT